MNVISYGGGTNSTAMLIGMYHKNIPADLILFADTGCEQPHTYEYLSVMDQWLINHGMPKITVVEYMDMNGDRLTLEQECLRSGTLPALAYGYKRCSLKHKAGPQEKFCNNYPPCREVWARGEKVASAVLTDTGLDIAYHPSFCPRIQGQKPCYFAKLPEEQKTRLFYDAVEVFCELFESEGIYSTLHDGLQMPNEEILARGYLTVEAMLAAGAVIALPENSDISLRDILQYELAEDLSLVHTQGGEPIFLEQEEELTRAERKRFSDVLDARVLETRAGEDGTEIVIDGVKPERLEQFRSVLDAYKPEAQSMKFIQ